MDLIEAKLTPVMDNYWKNYSGTRKEKKIHPSSFSSLCLREYYHILVGEAKKEEPPVPMKRLLCRAKIVHEEIQRIWAEMGILEGKWKCWKCGKTSSGKNPSSCSCGSKDFQFLEVPLSSKEFGMVGHADGILVIDGEKKLGEIKSISTFKFNSLHRPEPNHIIQVHCYFLMSGFNSCLIMYCNRDNGDYKIFQIDKIPSLEEKIRKQLIVLNNCLRERIPPPLNCENDNNYCQKSCSAKNVCQKKWQELEDWMLEEDGNAKSEKQSGRGERGRKASSTKEAHHTTEESDDEEDLDG